MYLDQTKPTKKKLAENQVLIARPVFFRDLVDVGIVYIYIISSYLIRFTQRSSSRPRPHSRCSARQRCLGRRQVAAQRFLGGTAPGGG